MPKIFQLDYGSRVEFEKELLSDDKGMNKIFFPIFLVYFPLPINCQTFFLEYLARVAKSAISLFL